MNKVEFTPMQGILNVGEIIARRFGLMRIFAGEEGLGSVIREKLKDMGVPDKPVTLVDADMTPRQMAERVGFIKKRKRLK